MVGPGALFFLVLAVFYVSEDQSATIVVALGVAAYYLISTRSTKDANVVPPDAGVIQKLQQDIAVLKAGKSLERLSEENTKLRLQCQAQQKDVGILEEALERQKVENKQEAQQKVENKQEAQRLQTKFDESQKSTAKDIARLQKENKDLSEKCKQLQTEAEQKEKNVQDLLEKHKQLQTSEAEQIEKSKLLACQIADLITQNQDLNLKLNPSAAGIDRLTPASITAMTSEQVAQHAVERARCFHECVKSDFEVGECVGCVTAVGINGGTYRTEWTSEKLSDALAREPYFQGNPSIRGLIIGALVAMREEADSAVAL
jgi:hypothetical protein